MHGSKREEKRKRDELENQAEMRVEGEGEEEWWRRERGWCCDAQCGRNASGICSQPIAKLARLRTPQSPQLRMRSRSIVTPVTLPPFPSASHMPSHAAAPWRLPWSLSLSLAQRPLRPCCCCCCSARRRPRLPRGSKSPRRGFRLLLGPPSPATPSLIRRPPTSLP